MNFGISGTSTVANNTTYMDVLQGFGDLTSLGVTSTGTFNSYSYSLVLDPNNANDWNLVIGAGSTGTDGGLGGGGSGGLSGAAPEMNTSDIPQVALLISCLFFMGGRTKSSQAKQWV